MERIVGRQLLTKDILAFLLQFVLDHILCPVAVRLCREVEEDRHVVVSFGHLQEQLFRDNRLKQYKHAYEDVIQTQWTVSG